MEKSFDSVFKGNTYHLNHNFSFVSILFYLTSRILFLCNFKWKMVYRKDISLPLLNYKSEGVFLEVGTSRWGKGSLLIFNTFINIAIWQSSPLTVGKQSLGNIKKKSFVQWYACESGRIMSVFSSQKHPAGVSDF